MIEILKQKTEVKIGYNVTSLGDCVKLSHAILEITDKEINYNTLRRLFGIVKGGKPSDNTLKILAQFNGYKDYNHFLNSFPNENNLKYQIESYYLLSKPNSEELIAFIIHVKKFSKNFINNLIQIIRELYYQEKFSLIDKIFNLDILKMSNYTYDEVLQIGNSIGFIFRTKKTTTDDITSLLSNANFQDMIFTVFVDYSALSSYYGDWTNKLLNQKKRDFVDVFCKCILNLKSYLNNQKITYKELSFKNHYHPILIGRVISQKLFINDKSIYDDLKTMSQLEGNLSNLNIQFYYEIIFTSLFCKRFDIMKHIIEVFSNIRNFNYHYSIHHYSQFYLMCCIYFFKTNNTEMFEVYRRKINEEHLRLGYKNLLILMLSVLNFHSSKDQEHKSLTTYNEISNSLNLKRLNQSFLIHYFD